MKFDLALNFGIVPIYSWFVTIVWANDHPTFCLFYLFYSVVSILILYHLVTFYPYFDIKLDDFWDISVKDNKEEGLSDSQNPEKIEQIRTDFDYKNG